MALIAACMAEYLFALEEHLPLLSAPVGAWSRTTVSELRGHFQWRRFLAAHERTVVARTGAIDDDAIRPEPAPQTWGCDALPPVAEVEDRFGWPVFDNGNSRTGRSWNVGILLAPLLRIVLLAPATACVGVEAENAGEPAEGCSVGDFEAEAGSEGFAVGASMSVASLVDDRSQEVCTAQFQGAPGF